MINSAIVYVVVLKRSEFKRSHNIKQYILMDTECPSKVWISVTSVLLAVARVLVKHGFFENQFFSVFMPTHFFIFTNNETSFLVVKVFMFFLFIRLES